MQEPGGLQSMESQRVRHDLATKSMMTKSIFKGIKHEKGEYLRLVDLLKAGIEMRVLP